MARASLTYGRGVLVGGLVLTGLVGMFALVASAQPPRSKPRGGVVGKGPTTPPRTNVPSTLQMTIVSEGADVAEMAKRIDERLEAGWKANKITPAAVIDDHAFIRRATLDIVGRVATRKEIADFFARVDPETKKPIRPDQRRSRYIEYLLANEDYPRHWGRLWANWLLTRAGEFGRGPYHDSLRIWLEDQFATNRPYSEIVMKLLTATGNNLADDEDRKIAKNGATNFILAHLGEPIRNTRENPRRVAEEGYFEMVPLTSRITRVFLGTQVQCAQCHAHPFFSTLKQEMFWGVNAFLRQIKREGARTGRRPQRGMEPANLTLTDDASVAADANVFFELRNGKIKMWHAEFLPSGSKERGPKLDPKYKGLARREQLARYVIDHEMFTRSVVNRMWGLYFGRGFVNPIDDFHDNNQPSHPELLQELANRFKHYNYDLKKLIRWMTHARAYHLSHVANATNDKVEQETQFARMNMKALSPEQLFESLMTATQAAKALDRDKRRELEDQWLGQLITNFGDDEGNEITFNGTIVQALLLMNGKNLNDAIAAKTGTVAQVMSTNRLPREAITQLYLAALNRPPRPAELTRVLEKMKLRSGFKDTSKAQYEDLFWALLNSNEFLLNH